MGTSPLPAATIAAEPESRRLYSEGMALLRAKAVPEAIARLGDAAARADADQLAADERSLLYYALGVALGRAGRDTDAVAALRQALSLGPEDSECRLELALRLLHKKEFADAKQEAAAALRQGFDSEADAADAALVVRLADAELTLIAGKELLKKRQYEEAASKLAQSAALATQAKLGTEELALRYDLLGMALSRARKDAEAIVALRQAVRLSPGDADSHLELAQVLFRSGQYQDTQSEAQEALSLGPTDPDDRREAQSLIRRARLEYLRERLSAFLSVSFGYDSNILESNIGACMTGCSGGAFEANVASLPQVQALRASPNSPAAVTAVYNYPLVRREWDLPTTLQLELAGRMVGRKSLEIWGGYRFYQYLLASVAFDHDSYNFQEHAVPLYLSGYPWRWLRLRPQIEGFVNFTGLRTFQPYQGGVRLSLDATFIESPRFRTRLYYLNQLRRSFDRTGLSYLDGDRSDLKITQELRQPGARVQVRGLLSYRFRSDSTGAYDTRVPPPDSPAAFSIPSAAGSTTLMQVGTVDYVEPLGYLGNEVSTRWRLYLPAGFELFSGVSYEYRIYDNTPMAPIFNPANGGSSFSLPLQQRRDSLVGFDLSARKNLPYGAAVEVSYTMLDNISTLANWIDNRNYLKHAITLNLSYDL